MSEKINQGTENETEGIIIERGKGCEG